MYICYDTETTGLDKIFSQILQVAMVFADDDLNILSSKKAECRRSPWIVPTPGSLLTTGFVPDDLKNNPLSHYELMKDINDWARSQHWPVIFLGYNTLGYDESVLSVNFAQNLMHDDLTTAVNNVNGQENGRFDVMIAVIAALVYAPGALTLVIKNNFGQPSLSLGNVAKQNGVTLDGAHDAMNDIRATIGVAKAVKKAAPHVYDQLMKMATLSGVNKFLEETPVFTYTRTFHNKQTTRTAAAVTEREGSDTHILFDLTFDPVPYLAMTEEQLAETFRNRDASGQGKGQQQPFILVRKKSQPVFMPLEYSDAVLPKDFDEKQASERAAVIRADEAFQERVSKAAATVKREEAKDYKDKLPEQQFDKEITPELRARIDHWMHEFHDAATWQARRALVADFIVRFSEEIKADETLLRFPKFGTRIIFEHAPAELDVETQERMQRYIAARILNPDPDAAYATIPQARKELEKIEKDRSSGKGKWKDVTDTQIRSLKLYYRALEKEFTPFAPVFPAVTPPSNDNGSAAPEASKKIADDKMQPK